MCESILYEFPGYPKKCSLRFFALFRRKEMVASHICPLKFGHPSLNTEEILTSRMLVVRHKIISSYVDVASKQQNSIYWDTVW